MKNDRQVYFGSGFKYVNHLPSPKGAHYRARAQQIAKRKPIAVYVIVGLCLGFVLIGCFV
jgi:hypothetical protein